MSPREGFFAEGFTVPQQPSPTRGKLPPLRQYSKPSSALVRVTVGGTIRFSWKSRIPVPSGSLGGTIRFLLEVSDFASLWKFRWNNPPPSGGLGLIRFPLEVSFSASLWKSRWNHPLPCGSPGFRFPLEVSVEQTASLCISGSYPKEGPFHGRIPSSSRTSVLN